jgi:hypothetical protein
MKWRFEMKTKMQMLRLKISTKSYRNAERWDHTEIDSTPYLDYDYAEGTNWKATDTRLSDRTAVARFKHTYWEQTTIDPSQRKYHYIGKRRVPNAGRMTNNLALYEDELEREIQKAIAKVNQRFQSKYKADFELEFADDLVKFLKSK